MARRCLKCGYDLAGLKTGVCPECGRPFSRRIAFEQEPLTPWMRLTQSQGLVTLVTGVFLAAYVTDRVYLPLPALSTLGLGSYLFGRAAGLVIVVALFVWWREASSIFNKPSWDPGARAASIAAAVSLVLVGLYALVVGARAAGVL